MYIFRFDWNFTNIITTVDSRYSANQISTCLAHKTRNVFAKDLRELSTLRYMYARKLKIRFARERSTERLRERERERERESKLANSRNDRCILLTSVHRRYFSVDDPTGKMCNASHRRCRLLTYRRARSVNHAGNWRRTEARVNTRRRRVHGHACVPYTGARARLVVTIRY